MTTAEKIDRKTALDLYRVMRTIRSFEERSMQLFGENKIWGTIHSYAGEEAIAAGVCANLRDDDWITSTHRGHGHCIAKGADLGRMFAELLGRETGCCRGRGGSMHIADIAKRADGYGMPGVHVDGRDVRAVHAAAGEAVARARTGRGPTLVVADSYRHEGHYYGDPRKYQSKEEIDGWRRQFDPLADARTWILADRLASDADLDTVDQNIATEIDRAVAWAEEAPLASPIKLPDDVYASH